MVEDISNDDSALFITAEMERGRKAFIGQPKDRHTDEIFYEEFSCQGRKEIIKSIVSLVINKAGDCDTLIWRIKPELAYENKTKKRIGCARPYMRFAFVRDGKQVKIL